MARLTETLPAVYLLLLDTPVHGIPIGVYPTAAAALEDAVLLGLPETTTDLSVDGVFRKLHERYMESSYAWNDCGFKANRRICGYVVEKFVAGVKVDHQTLEPYRRIEAVEAQKDQDREMPLVAVVPNQKLSI